MPPMDPAMMGMDPSQQQMMAGMGGQLPSAAQAQFAPQGAPPAATGVGGSDIGGLVQDLNGIGQVMG
jgi:hypothetical protein